MINTLKVTYKSTANALTANTFLRDISKHPVIACDFEVASKYTDQERALLQAQLSDESLPHLSRMEAKAKLHSTALDHPSHTVLTHLSVAVSETEAYVFILDNPAITRRVLQFLITTPQKQVWHNFTFDGKHILHRTGKLPLDFEDTQIFMKTLINHVDVHKANTGLKDLAGYMYGSWGISSDNFTIAQMYEPHVLLYAATDACATLWLWNRLLSNTPNLPAPKEPYSPWDQLPAPEPRSCSYPESHFYFNTARHLIRDTIRIMSNGLPIDLNKVNTLDSTLDTSIEKVRLSLESNPIIDQYLEQKHSKELDLYIKDRESKLKTPEDYLKPFNPSDMSHRSYFMHVFSQRVNLTQPTETLPTGIPKWPSNLVKKLSSEYPLLKRLLAGEIDHTNLTAQESMNLLAQHKADMYNQKYLSQIQNPSCPKPSINPRSPDARHDIFTGILGYESGELTDAYQKYERDLAKAQRYNNPLPKEPKNKWSWGRKRIEFLLESLTDPNEISLAKDFIEFSFGDKIKTSFIPAFYNYTIDDRLYSNLKLLGAKSARYTSNNPNMLQLPSTGSIYAKPVKECFIAPPGKVILTADFNALEDRVLASITRDEGKCALLEDPTLDGHCYNALGYYPDKVLPYLTSKGDFKDKVREFAELVEQKHPQLKDVRQESKAVTFKIAYGGMPDAHKGGAITEEIYNNYHFKLYPGVRNYIDSYVIPTATTEGKIHLGLGFYIHTDNADKDQRTLHNAITI